MFDPNDSFNHENKENESAPVNDSSRTEQDSTSENTQANASGTQWDGEMYHGIPRTEDQQTSGTEETPKAGDSEPESSSQFPHSFTSDQDSDSANSGGAYSQYNTYGSDAKPDEPHWDMPYRPYGSAGSGPENPTPAPKKEKKHIFRKVLVGALACLIVSAGSVAGFAALINNGTIKIQSSSSSSTPAFTIVQDSTSSSSSASSSSSKTSTTNTATSSSELTKQEVAQKVLPSVVCIENYGNTSTQRSQYGYGSNNNNNNNGQDSSTDNSAVSPTSEGSGIIATTDGYIITNAHVVADAASLKVVLYNGKTYSATLVGSDSITDLALIKIDATGLTAAEFGSSDDLQVADTVMAIGNPGGLEFNSSVTVGYVSALNREITNSETGYTMKCIQTDAAINPGNSGGALVNMKGQVVGINSSKIVATGYEGLGFAIPINTAQPIISELKQYGYVKDRAVLGVSGQYVDSMTARFYGLSQGFYISSVSSDSVTSAGIQQGDVITEIDGKAVASQNTVASVIASKKPGDSVTLTVARASTGKTFTTTVKLMQATGKS